MKKILSLFLIIIMSVAFMSIANGPLVRPTTDLIKLDIKQKPGKPTILRANLEATKSTYIDGQIHDINVTYDGEEDGEVFLYLNGMQVDYYHTINSSFTISAPGLYTIEIVTDNWTAEGQVVI